MIKGLQYAAEKYDVKIIAQGANDWDAETTCAALEQVIPSNPDGIITAAWDAAMNPGILEAQEAGIPIIVVEAESGEKGDLYIGLDNVDAGRETAQELIDLAGDSGKLLVIGNWASRKSWRIPVGKSSAIRMVSATQRPLFRQQRICSARIRM